MSSDGPTAELPVRAALASGWPRLRVLTPDEGSLGQARAALEAVLGPLPQADLIEPWDLDSGEPWELRVDLPGLDAGRWGQVVDALAGHDAALSVGAPAGVTEADDRAQREVELLAGGGLEARRVGDPVDGRTLTLDLARPAGVDVEVVELEQELAEAVRSVAPTLQLRSDRGVDTVAPVVHRSSGRFGVELSLGPEAFEGLDGDAVRARREAVLAAVADVVRARGDHPRLRLAPDLRWDVPLGGLSLLVWALAPPAAALPGDAPIAGVPSAALLQGLCRDLGAMVRDLEVHVAPTDPAQHEAVALAVSGIAADQGWAGGRPRWVGTSAGWSFAPVWRVLHGSAEALGRGVDQALGVAGVAGVRVVSGEPSGLEDAWPVVDPCWWVGTRRCAVRLRDGVRDRDHLERVDPRPAQDADRALERAWRLQLADPAALGEVQPIVDRLGRPGLEARPGATALEPAGMASLLAAADALDEPHLCAVVTWAYVSGAARLRLWWRVDVPDRARVWRGQAAPQPL